MKEMLLILLIASHSFAKEANEHEKENFKGEVLNLTEHNFDGLLQKKHHLVMFYVPE